MTQSVLTLVARRQGHNSPPAVVTTQSAHVPHAEDVPHLWSLLLGKTLLLNWGRTMAAQDFCHCSQGESESVSDFIRRLERTFRLANGYDKMAVETRDTLLFGKPQEGLRQHLMEAPAVLGSATYAVLCQAAKTEEHYRLRQAELIDLMVVFE